MAIFSLYVKRQTFEVRPDRDRNSNSTFLDNSIVRIYNSTGLRHLEDYLRQTSMIGDSHRIRGLNIDYKPTGRFSHRVIITVLFQTP